MDTDKKVKPMLKKELTNQILEAMQNPYLWNDIEKYLIDEKQLFIQHDFGNLRKKEFKQRLKQLRKDVSPIIVYFLPQLEAVLKYLSIDELIAKDLLKDMHMKSERIKTQGHPCRFAIWFYKAINGGTTMFCATQVYFENKKRLIKR